MCGRNRHREDHQDVVLGDFGEIEAQAGDQSQLDHICSQSQYGFNTVMSMIRKHSFVGCLLFWGLVLACIYSVTVHSTPVRDSKPLTPQEEHIVADALAGPDSKILVSMFEIKRSEMRLLKPAGWITTKLIGAYMKLLEDWVIRRNADESYPEENKVRARCFHPGFFKLLTEGHLRKNFTENYRRIHEWYEKAGRSGNFDTHEISDIFFYSYIIGFTNENALLQALDAKDIFNLDLLLIPIQPHGNHWTLMSLDMKTKTAEYYDSLGWKSGKAVWTYLKAFLRLEWMNKRDGNGYDEMEKWKLKEYVPGIDTPKQENNSDSGVFVCKTAEYLLDGRELTFTQSDMETFRKRMVLDLLNSQTDRRLQNQRFGFE
eukprot:482621_1